MTAAHVIESRSDDVWVDEPTPPSADSRADTSRAAEGDWPSSALTAVRRAFDVLVAPPTTYLLHSAHLPGVPEGAVDPRQMQRFLLTPTVSVEIRDVVWRQLVTRARDPQSPGAAWMVIAAGMALPGLIAVARRLVKGRPQEAADVDAEVLAGFVAAVKTVDLDEPRIAGRLIDAAARAGRRARREVERADVVSVDTAWSRAPSQPWAHPDWVLARAVAGGVIDLLEARLIGVTRLEDVPVRVVAEWFDIDLNTAVDWRRRAEVRLVRSLHNGDLDPADSHLRLAPDAGVKSAQRQAARRARAHRALPG